MDQPIKTLTTLIVTFICAFFLLSILTFGIVSNNARTVLYTVEDFIEINGYDQEVIQNYAEKTNTQIEVTPINEGVYANGGMNRFKVQVSFKHFLAWINFEPRVTYTAITRGVEY